MTCPVVYEFWAGPRPLYVGVTNNFSRRLGQHRSGFAYMVAEADRVRLSFFLEREDANSYESDRIWDLRPRFNLRGNPDYRPDLPDPLGDAWARDCRQVDLDAVFRATALGPTSTFSKRERRDASLRLLISTRVLRAA